MAGARPGARRRATRSRRFPPIRSIITVAALAVALTPTLAHARTHARTGCQTARCMERVASKQCSQTRVVACIRYASLKYRLSPAQHAWMLRVSSCESGRNPYARNPSGASGTFQFMPGTWRTTPYAARSIWSARYQSLAAAWMLRQGRVREWVCR